MGHELIQAETLLGQNPYLIEYKLFKILGHFLNRFEAKSPKKFLLYSKTFM
jgi:hypothetical protein